MMGFSNRIRKFAASPTVITVVVLTLLWAFFFWRLLTPSTGDRVIFTQGDFTQHFYAFSQYQAERLWKGEIPLWNPYNYAGDPFAANTQLEVWYPPRWIAIFLAGKGGWDIEAHQLEVAAHYWIASLLMAAFLRALVKRPYPALLGSILWTYGGYLTGYPMLQPSIAEAITWLPLMLLGAHLSLTRPRWRVRGMLLAGGMMGLSFLGGHTQTTLEMTYLTAAYLAFVGWQHGIRWKGIAWRVALFGLCGAAISAVQLLPTTEFTLLAYRSESYHFADKANGFTLPELIQFVWPRLFKAEWWPLYTGVIGGLLALNAVLRPRREYYFWIGVIVVGVWLSLGGRSSVYDAFYLVAPGFSVFRDQERIASVLVFALVVLATYQLDRLLYPERAQQTAAPDQDERRLTWLARGHLALAGIVFAVLTLALLIREKAPNDPTANAAGHVVLISLMFNAWLIWRQHTSPQRIISAALLGLLVVDLFSVGMDSPNFVADNEYNRIPPPDNLELLSPPLDQIQWHVDGAAGLQGYGTYWQVPDIYGTIPFSLATTEKLRQIRVDRRWEVFAVRYAMMTAAVPDNVPVTVVDEGVNYDGEDYTLYELTDPRPFAQLVYQVRVSDDGLDGERTIMKEPILDLREIGVTDHALPFDLPGQRPADARVDAFKMVMPEYMEMSVTTSDNALLTVAVANYPGWQAEVNGQNVDIIDTYAGLIGIPIQAGANQKVTLRFLPRSVLLGGAISALTLIVIAGYVLGVFVIERRRPSPPTPLP